MLRFFWSVVRVVNRYSMLFPVLMVLAACSVSGQVVGPPNPAATATEPQTYAPVKIGGRVLFEVIGVSGLSAAERADKVNRRLVSLIQRNEELPAFTLKEIAKHANASTITLAGEPILTVTDADSQDALSDRDVLALGWGQKMVQAVNDQHASHSNLFAGSGILLRNSLSDLILALTRWLPQLAGAIIIMVVFGLLARFNRWATKSILARERFDSNLRHLLRSLIYYGTWIAGILAALYTLGLNGSSIAATVGISGVILGFAFKDILAHLFAGLMLLIGRHYHVGDQIVVREFEGTVERIELRAMYLRTYDNRLVIIPNGDVFTAAVTSNTDNPLRRREFVIRIGYGENINKVMQIVLDSINVVEGVAAVPPSDILVDELAAATVNLKVRFYTNSHRADFLRVGSECMMSLKEALDDAHISLANENTMVLLRDRPADTELKDRASLPTGGDPAT